LIFLISFPVKAIAFQVMRYCVSSRCRSLGEIIAPRGTSIHWSIFGLNMGMQRLERFRRAPYRKGVTETLPAPGNCRGESGAGQREA
jgi:hypothetical protein